LVIRTEKSSLHEEIGFPFLARLGRAFYGHELGRDRPRRPDLSRFRVRP
jgi:hypothetical protein